MKKNTFIKDVKDIEIAIQLINLGARLQVLEYETNVSRCFLIKLYKEIIGTSPSKGLLPFSTDWFTVWENNIHASTFYNIYSYLIKTIGFTKVETLIKSYRLYLEQCPSSIDNISLLSITRAWMLVRFVESDMLHLSSCNCCGGNFVTHPYHPAGGFLCSFCHTPSRANKRKLTPTILANSTIRTVITTH